MLGKSQNHVVSPSPAPCNMARLLLLILTAACHAQVACPLGTQARKWEENRHENGKMLGEPARKGDKIHDLGIMCELS